MTIYTLIIVCGIHSYEAKIKNYNSQIETHTKSYHNSVDTIALLDEQNKLLQQQIKLLKEELISRPIEYESSYVNPHNNPLGK